METTEDNFPGCYERDYWHFQSTSELPVVLKRNENYVRLTNLSPSDRLVTKHGRTTLPLTRIPNKHLRFIRDLGNTLIHIRWRWILLTLAIVNSVAYLAFSGIWMLVAWLDGDMNMNEASTSGKCVMGADHFTEYLLLSIETITTTGYGYVYPSDDCTLSWLVLTLSTVTVILIDGAFFTVVYVKITRPVKKDVVKFSKKAVICLRNGVLCLVFRISDRHGKHWLRTQIKVFVVAEKEEQRNYVQTLKVEDCGVLLWPVDVVHKITEGSPLWDVSANDIMTKQFEIVVVVNGDCISSGQPSQSQVSYLSKEILWGYRFESCMEISPGKPNYVVDHQLFNRIVPFDTPLCSARDLESLQNQMSFADL